MEIGKHCCNPSLCFKYSPVHTYLLKHKRYGLMRLKPFSQNSGSNENKEFFHHKFYEQSNHFASASPTCFSWCSLSKLFGDFLIQDICLNWNVFITSNQYHYFLVIYVLISCWLASFRYSLNLQVYCLFFDCIY